MRIVIAGAGRLGYSIAALLSEEGMDVVVVDGEESQLEAAKTTLDVLTIEANIASPLTMNDPDIKSADILIAVTDSDEVNIVACVLAKKHGITHTIARIRDMNVTVEAGQYLKENFDIDLVLNPELITANEISRILMTPAALNVEDFAQGKVRLFETRIRRRSAIARKPLKELTLPHGVLAGLIFRDHRMIIPHGDDMFLPGDNAYFIGLPDRIEEFSQSLVPSDTHELKRVAIIGAGRTGRGLALLLEGQGVQVKVIDRNRERCELLAEKLTTGLAICGDGTDIDLLTEEGVAEADVIVCLTEDDKLNLMLALLARHLSNNKIKTVVRVDRNEYIDLMEKVGVNIALSARLLSASEVLAYARGGDVTRVTLLEGARAEALEVIVSAGAPVVGKKLMNANLPRECLVCAYVREEAAAIPNGMTELQPGDRVILFVLKSFAKKALAYFGDD